MGVSLVVFHYSSLHKNSKHLRLANNIINLSQRTTAHKQFVKYEYNLDDSKMTMSGLQYNWLANYMLYQNSNQRALD